MALQYLKREPIKYFEIWENSPRLPQSIQTKLAPLNAEEKLKEVVEHYLKNEEVLNLCRAMSVLGFSPIDNVLGLSRNGKLVIFEGNRRLIAAEILLNPNLIKDIDYLVKDCEDTTAIQAYDMLQRYRADMSEELVDTLRELPILEFNSSLYTLESATMESMASSGALNEEVVCAECGRWEFAEGETECGDCGCAL